PGPALLPHQLSVASTVVLPAPVRDERSSPVVFPVMELKRTVAEIWLCWLLNGPMTTPKLLCWMRFCSTRTFAMGCVPPLSSSCTPMLLGRLPPSIVLPEMVTLLRAVATVRDRRSIIAKKLLDAADGVRAKVLPVMLTWP